MEPDAAHHILYAERAFNGVVIGFDDGKTVLFSAATLHAAIWLGEDLTDLPDPDAD